MENKYEYKTTVTGNDIAFNNKLSIAGVMSLFQLVCGMHTYNAKVDYKNVQKKYNGKWVITDVRFEISRLPQYSESVSISTWPLKPKPIRFPRIFELKDADGQCVVSAYTNWCLLDANTDALMHTHVLGDPFGEYLEDKPLSPAPRDRGAEFAGSDLHHTHIARISDLDMNSHVNNVSYIKMALDCFDSKEYESLTATACNVYYKSQAYEGEKIDLYRKDTDGKIYIEARAGERIVFLLTLEV